MVIHYKPYASILKRSTLKQSCKYTSPVICSNNFQQRVMSLANYLTFDYNNNDNENETDDSNDDNYDT